MKSGLDIKIITNNPLVVSCLRDYYEIEYHEISFREILVKVRDLVYEGYELRTHPIAGSVKPNETPYKSIVVSKKKLDFVKNYEDYAKYAKLCESALITFDKFTPIGWTLPERILQDFQLIDYTLLAGALDFDAAAGLSKLP